jgi:hypothetical protein
VRSGSLGKHKVPEQVSTAKSADNVRRILIVGSSDYLLYIIVITPEDGRHEGPKHVVLS